MGVGTGTKIEENFENFISEVPVPSSSSFNISRYRERSRDRIISEHLGKQNYEKPHTTVTEILNCVRQNYYYRSKYQIDLDKYFKFIYLKLYADVGTAIHKYVQDTYGFSEVEKPIFSDNYKVKGKVDAIDGNCIYELKSTETSKFKNTYEEDHYHQGNIYSYILNTEYKYNIRNITIVYFFRDNLKKDPVGFDVPLNKELALSFLTRSPILLESIQKRIVPDKIGSSPEKCKWCMYKDYCGKDEIIIEENTKIPMKASTSFKM